MLTRGTQSSALASLNSNLESTETGLFAPVVYNGGFRAEEAEESRMQEKEESRTKRDKPE